MIAINKKIKSINENSLSFNNIKTITKELAKYTITDYSDHLNVENEFSSDFTDACISLFIYRKTANKNFHSFGNSELKKIKVSDDEDISPNEILTIVDYFKKNPNHFYSLVRECFVVSKETNNCDGDLFYGQFKSPFSNKNVDLFMIKNNNHLYVVENNTYTKELRDYLTEYYNIAFSKECSKLFSELDFSTQCHISFQSKLNDLFFEISKAVSETRNLKKGMITFLDFLGWKGLWQTDGDVDALEKVSTLIENSRIQLNDITKEYLTNKNDSSISELISISDTIAIFTPKCLGLSNNNLLDIHARISRYILENATKMGYAIRGAITYGEYSIQNNIMIGPGIDECASWHETCDWIGVHLSPSAQFLAEENKIKDSIILWNDIPTKSGIPKVKYCVDWQIDKHEFDMLKNKSKAILPTIAAKYFNTYNYLFDERRKNHGNTKNDSSKS